MRCTAMRYAREVHGHEVHTRDMHAHEVHACEMIVSGLHRHRRYRRFLPERLGTLPASVPSSAGENRKPAFL
jgi:hypothetical protein